MRKIAVILILAAFILSPPIMAEEIPTFSTKEAYIASAGVKKTLNIGMVDCVAMALKNNFDIQITKITPLIEDTNVMVKRAKFEPSLSFDWTMEDDTEISPSTLSMTNISKTRTADFNLGYDQKFVTGTKLDVNFYNTRTTSNSAIQVMNPEFDSQAGITITQPLLKGFGIIVNKAEFLIARNNRLKSQQDFTRDLIKILTDVKKSYYALLYTQEQYKVAVAALKRVQNLHDINKEKYIKGLASNVDLLQSEAEVARTEEALFNAEGNMKLAEDNLRLITNLVEDIELWNASIVLLDKVAYEKKEANLIDSVTRAFEHRPDYEAQKIELKNKDISVIYYRNGMLPTMDLVGSYSLNGLAKTFNKDMRHIGGGKYPDWVVGVAVNLPLGSEKEKGEYEKSKLEKRQALLNFQLLEQKIILEVRNAVRNVDIKYRVLEASKKSKEAEEENYEVQESRFKAGLVSTLDMTIFYERLTTAQVNYIKSVIDYNITLIELAKAEGTTLLNDNIVLE